MQLRLAPVFRLGELEIERRKKHTKKTKLFATAIVLILIATMLMTIVLSVAAQNFSLSFDTVGYLSVSPKTIGINQQLLVNLWVHPQPSGPAPPTTGMINQSYTGISVTFTRPDGTKDTFMPVEPGSGLSPGAAEMTGAIWFNYQPTQIGTWILRFYAQKTIEYRRLRLRWLFSHVWWLLL